LIPQTRAPSGSCASRWDGAEASGDREFHTIFGFERDEIRRIAERWPDWDDSVEQTDAINAALNNLLGYPHQRWDAWHDYVSPVSSKVACAYTRWRGESDLDQSGNGYFDRLQ
jgi:hypothetical protein